MVNKLPEGWKNKSLKDVCLVVKDKGNVGDFPYLEIGNIDLNSKRYAFSDKRAVKGCKRAQQNDVLVSRVRPTRGAIVSIKEDSLAVSSAFTILRSQKDKITDRYLLRSLSGNQSFLNYMGNNCTGTMYPTVSEKTILEYLIPVAPIDKQERIADKLDSLFAKVKDAQFRLDKIPIILDRFRQSILAAAFSGDLTEKWRRKNDIDSKWQMVKLGEVLKDLKYGTSQKCSKTNKKYPILRIPNVVQGYIDLADLKYADLGKKEYEKLKLEQGDILLIRSNGSVSLLGRTALVGEQEHAMAYAGYLIRLRSNRDLIIPEFLQYQLQSYKVRLQIELPARSTSGVNNINSKEVRNLQIVLPSVAEQKEIVRQINQLFGQLSKIKERYEKINAYTNKLEQSILDKAFRGGLFN